jgi:glutathione S-transferase
MPRPDLALLPVSYRRIPLLAIGRDIYLDTRLILRVLESLPSTATSSPPLGATAPADMFTQQLLERYMIEGPVFAMAAGLVPVDVAQDPTFKKDRKGMLGKTWEREELDEGRAESVNYIRSLFGLLEGTVLSDGREWMLGGEGPKMADVEGEWRDSLRM